MSEPTDFPPIVTARLLLRPHRLEDAAALSALSDDPDVVRYLARVPYPNPPEQVRAYIQGALERLSAGTEAPLTVTLAETGNVIGSFSIRMNGLRREAEVGYWLGKAYWGQGLASEAVRAAVDYALGPLGCRRVWATVSVDNPASRRVLAKAGLTGDERRWIKTPARETDEAEVYLVEHLAPRAPLLVAAVALVDRDGRVLLAQRPEGKQMAGLWEFPGGKVDPGETPEAALIRELREELGVDTAESCLAPFTFASHSYDDFHLLMPLYVCRVWEGQPQPLEGQTLAWARPNEMKNYPMPPADKPLVAMLRDLL